jgi:anti-anti-sigma factor
VAHRPRTEAEEVRPVRTGDDALDIEMRDGALHLVGELDVASAPRLVHVLEWVTSEGAGPLRFDLSALSFIDSVGLRELIRAQAQHGVVVVNPSPVVERLFEITGVTHSFTGERDEL